MGVNCCFKNEFYSSGNIIGAETQDRKYRLVFLLSPFFCSSSFSLHFLVEVKWFDRLRQCRWSNVQQALQSLMLGAGIAVFAWKLEDMKSFLGRMGLVVQQL